MEEEKSDFKMKVIEEAKMLRNKQIKELKEKEILSKEEKEFLEVLENQNWERRSDKEVFRDNYYKIIQIIDYYLDLKPEYQNIVALWIIGTYLHKDFDSYPYLFINAMRGSGKSRLLRLIGQLSYKGSLVNSLTDAVFFRTIGTLAIDEFESVASKEKQSIRELLNSAYKKGSKVYRMKQKKTMNGTEQVVEEFENYRPIVMANIWGMDEVLGDRCITIILEKSSDHSKIKLVEDYENNDSIKIVRLQFFQCSLCSVVSIKNVYKEWNNYIKNKNLNYTYTYNTYNTLSTQSTSSLLDRVDLDRFFTKIDESGISGRNLEIFLPIFLIAKVIGDDVLNLSIKTSSDLVFEKKHEEEVESMDVMLIDYTSKIHGGINEWFSIKQFTNEFKNFIGHNEDWLNEKWVGRALKRLGLIISKRRASNGIQVIINSVKAKEKMKMFETGELK